MKNALAIVLIIGLCSCNMERFVKRQLDKHPEWATDSSTTIVTDTIKIPEYRIDTVVYLNLHDSTDTVYIENDTVRVELIRYRDRLQVKTIVKTQNVPYTKTVYKNRYITLENKETKKQLWIAKALLMALLIIGLIRYVRAKN